jgi:copper chaperone NosL
MIVLRARSLVIPLTIIISGMTGCRQRDPLAPPRVHYGQDICDVCGMIISDERYAAVAVARDQRGGHRPLRFDDVGCLLVCESDPDHLTITARYVKDFETRQWLAIEDATFLHSRELHSPMAFGAAACAPTGAAEALRKRYGGGILTVPALRQRFGAGGLRIDGCETADGDTDNDNPDQDAPFAALFDATRVQRVETAESGESILVTALNGPDRPVGTQPFVLLIGREGPDGGLEPVEDLDVLIEPSMPSMGHGSQGNVHPEPAGAGRYEGPINLTMPGPWIVHVTLQRGGVDIAALDLGLQVHQP